MQGKNVILYARVKEKNIKKMAYLLTEINHREKKVILHAIVTEKLTEGLICYQK